MLVTRIVSYTHGQREESEATVPGEKPRHRHTDDKHQSDKPNPQPNPEFEKFEDLTKKLLKVPKEELDEKRAQREREKRAG